MRLAAVISGQRQTVETLTWVTAAYGRATHAQARCHGDTAEQLTASLDKECGNAKVKKLQDVPANLCPRRRSAACLRARAQGLMGKCDSASLIRCFYS